MPHNICIRSAEAGDVEAIHALLLPHAEKRVLLPRSIDDIFQHLQEFLVAEYDGRLAGVVALHVYTSSLGEIRSLVVDADTQHHGIGSLLVEACEKWAAGLGIATVFALTYVTGFFLRQGYEVVSKESFPHKIWTVCVHCAKFADCDEVAVQKKLAEAPVKPMRLIPVIEVKEA
ncbi:MAG TPA: N-acetyltransferase [Mariprofundaceae bacterium]|nr:N-acetyltransferase [Mariprofundaceae bacterium]